MRTFHLLVLLLLSGVFAGVDVFCAARLAAAESSPLEQRVLVLKNGDRVTGRLLSVEEKVLRFQSDSFGLIEVQRDQLQVDPWARPASVPAGAEGPTAATPSGASQPVPDPKSDPWTFWFNASTELKRDSGTRKNILVEGTARRPWPRGEFRTKASYEYTQENDRTTTDLQKLELYGRYDFAPRWFVVYSPQEEYNRHQVISGVRINYVFLRQMVGFGRALIDRPGGRLRVGVAENFFDIWAWRGRARAHADYRIESLFAEAEFQLPWRLKLTDRASLFYSVTDYEQGYENIFELTRSLDTHWRLSLRHELRHDYPGINVSDLNLWRFVLGLEY